MATQKRIIYLDMRLTLSNEHDRKKGLLLNPEYVQRLNALKGKKTSLWPIFGPENPPGLTFAAMDYQKVLRKALLWAGCTVEVSGVRLPKSQWVPATVPSSYGRYQTFTDEIAAIQNKLKSYATKPAFVIIQARKLAGATQQTVVPTVLVDDVIGLQDEDIILADQLMRDQEC